MKEHFLTSASDIRSRSVKLPSDWTSFILVKWPWTNTLLQPATLSLAQTRTPTTYESYWHMNIILNQYWQTRESGREKLPHQSASNAQTPAALYTGKQKFINEANIEIELKFISSNLYRTWGWWPPHQFRRCARVTCMASEPLEVVTVGGVTVLQTRTVSHTKRLGTSDSGANTSCTATKYRRLLDNTTSVLK